MNYRPIRLFASLLFCFVFLGCVSRSRPSSYDTYLRVHPPKANASAYVLERGTSGQTFDAGTVSLHGAPHENMGPHMVGALPASTGVFRLWEGADYKNPLPRFASVEIPAHEGPWRGVVAELKSGTKYPAVRFTPVPEQKPRRGRPLVSTEVLYCDTANILACVPWERAVERGWVTCEKPTRERLPASSCSAYVPYTEWYVRERAANQSRGGMARSARASGARAKHAGALSRYL